MPQGITHKHDVFVVLLSLLAETPVVAYREASFHPTPREREEGKRREREMYDVRGVGGGGATKEREEMGGRSRENRMLKIRNFKISLVLSILDL